MHTLSEVSTLLLSELRARAAGGTGLSARALAARAILSQPHVCHILGGKRRLTIETADALMLASGLSIEDLLARPADPPADCPAPPRRARRATPRMTVYRAA